MFTGNPSLREWRKPLGHHREQEGRAFWQEMDSLVEQLDGLVTDAVEPGTSIIAVEDYHD